MRERPDRPPLPTPCAEEWPCARCCETCVAIGRALALLEAVGAMRNEVRALSVRLLDRRKSECLRRERRVAGLHQVARADRMPPCGCYGLYPQRRRP